MYCAMSTVSRRKPPRREGGCVEAVLERREITTELIADGKHLPPELLRLTVKAKGMSEVCFVTDAMRGAGMPEGAYAFGPKHGQTALVQEGAALMPDRSSFASSIVTMDVMVVRFRRDGELQSRLHHESPRSKRELGGGQGRRLCDSR
jgi:N-acetylglucosamine-6-phosphate deacetylase